MLINKRCQKCNTIFEVWENTLIKCIKTKHECPSCKVVALHERCFSSIKIAKFGLGKKVPGYEKDDGSCLGARIDARGNKWF